MDDQQLTHVVPCSAEAISRRWQTYKALCGATVEPWQFARDGDPTCPACKRIDGADSAALEALKAE